MLMRLPKHLGMLWIPPLIKVEQIWPIIFPEKLVHHKLKELAMDHQQLVQGALLAGLKAKLLKALRIQSSHTIVLTPRVPLTTSQEFQIWLQRFLVSIKTRKIVKNFQIKPASIHLRETRHLRHQADKASFRSRQLPWTIRVHHPITSSQRVAPAWELLRETIILLVSIILTGAVDRMLKDHRPLTDHLEGNPCFLSRTEKAIKQPMPTPTWNPLKAMPKWRVAVLSNNQQSWKTIAANLRSNSKSLQILNKYSRKKSRLQVQSLKTSTMEARASTRPSWSKSS